MGSGQQPSACKNRLIDETSPYLRQHAHNPVAWYPWGEDALRLARELNRPIFLSIGYSACHWCHVMAHESFEDPEVGQILNDHFISIKVDREERPDLDQIYMTAVQILSGQGGWPMSVFLTPDLQPFFAGTYFPPDDRHGRPSFKRLLRHLAQAWQEHHDVVVQQAGQLTDHLQEVLQPPPASGQLKAELLHHAARQLRGAFDSIYGGFGQAPKFPHPMDLRLLLRSWRRFGDDDGLAMVRTTLDHMARGGLYDHLGGGFHRYSTDARWLVPHFEKMLYDNALLTQVYLEAYQATGDLFYREIIEETIAYVLREMTSPQGPFYSTQDADSEGEEGKYFVWSLAEIEAVLGKEEAALFAAVYDVTAEGNWEGQNILNRARPFEQEAKLLNISEVDMRCRLEESRRKLLEVRERRVRPGRDEKVLTAWNGLMIAAMAEAGAVLNKPAWLAAAARAADFLLTHLRSADGRLLRTYSFGAGAKLNGYQEDYACLIDSLVSLYEATFEPRWLEAALDLLKVMQEQFWDRSFGGFFYTGKDHERLIARTKDVYDSSLPSGNGVAALALTRLGKLTGRQDLLKDAECIFTTNHTLLAQAPRAVGQLLLAFDFFLGPIQEWAIVGDPQAEETREVIRALRREFLPHRVLALQALGDESAEKLVPLLAGKQALGAVTTYLCEDFTCRQPVVGAAAVREVLGRLGK